MEEITQSRTIGTKTAFKISTELPYHLVFKATYQGTQGEQQDFQKTLITCLPTIGWPSDMDWSHVDAILKNYEKVASSFDKANGKVANIKLQKNYENPAWYIQNLREVKAAERENSIKTQIVAMFSQEQTLVNQDEQQVLLNESQAMDQVLLPNGSSIACSNDQEMPGTSKQYHQNNVF